MLLLSSKCYCHSDLKPENVTFIKIEGEKYQAKVIDFGELTRDKFTPKGYTPNYFLNPMRQYDNQGRIVLENMNEIFKNEFFTIVRSI
jgi:serine/threonine protein kinase